MSRTWIKVTLPMAIEADREAVAGLLADEFSAMVEEGGKGVTIWLEGEDPVAVAEDVSARATAVFPGYPFAAPEVEVEQETDWLAVWKQSVTPILIGDLFVVIPSWRTDEPMETGRLPIIIDPGMAFGTGHHPTTEGCLVALEKYRGHRVLDVGTGSGILAMAAALAGAEEVIGVDNDPEAIEVAIENLVLNDLVEPVSLLVGQIDDAPEGTYDLVVANIFLNALVSLADQFRKRVSVGGRLIISGLLAAQADDARAAMNAAGFVEIESIPIRGWTTVIFQG